MGSAFAINAIIESSAVSLLPSAPLTAPLSKAEQQSSPSSSSVCSVLPAFADLTNAATTATVTLPTDNDAANNNKINNPILVALPTQSKVGQTVAQCPLCRGNLWSYYADAGTLVTYLIASTLDRPWELEPDVHIYTRSRREFVSLNDGKPQFEENYPDRAVFYRPETKERVDALTKLQGMWRKQIRAAYKAQFAKI
ncbi:hypothetical protein TRIATDRAFT_299997 [Trichoderma atroviride IMI 206040]|uniref:Uncharacterized protein n=1 Tax=Hypocrea atroviridis (strain ATCC 20476 / IMI 206040) TaxID=452589 RepID=G9NWI5_HYPAI|nr:uncharacterized protein TRIATDRAFT_299997 [Trichoderma atroviride IMI 206040]EHK45340.1 hypothetical protein TRIATDRAFT_299997 [Trichoderma atroviride IMI 206040]